MAASHILALCITKICFVYGDMHTEWLSASCMSKLPLPIHATPICVASCGLCQCSSSGGVMCAVVMLSCACLCWGGIRGATVSLRLHECRPVSVWHSKREEQPAFTLVVAHTLTHSVYRISLCVCECWSVFILCMCVLCCPSSLGLWERPVCWLATPPMPSLVNTSPLCKYTTDYTCPQTQFMYAVISC